MFSVDKTGLDARIYNYVRLLQRIEHPIRFWRIAHEAARTRKLSFPIQVKLRGLRQHYELRTIDELGTFQLIFLSDLYAPTRSMRARLRGAFVIDGGAHCGLFSIYAVLMGARTVIAVEPIPGNAARLRAIISHLDFENRIHLTECALGATDGDASFICDGESTLSYSSYVETNGPKQIQVPMRSLQTLMRDYSSMTIDYLKMNCEGAEFGVIPCLDDQLLSRRCVAVVGWHAFAGLPTTPDILVKSLRERNFDVSMFNNDKLRFIVATR